jgi:hypothetical protein
MPLVALDSLPDDARTWVFGATPALEASTAERLLADVDEHLAGWKAHGEPLTVARSLMEGRFLIIAVDQRTAGASGCSIDGLFRALQRTESGYGVSLVAGGRVFWRDTRGVIQGGSRDDFRAAAALGTVTRDSSVFDTTVGTLGALRREFERPAARSWHAQLLQGVTVVR